MPVKLLQLPLPELVLPSSQLGPLLLVLARRSFLRHLQPTLLLCQLLLSRLRRLFLRGGCTKLSGCLLVELPLALGLLCLALCQLTAAASDGGTMCLLLLDQVLPLPCQLPALLVQIVTLFA